MLENNHQVFGGTPFPTVADPRIPNQKLVLLTGDQLRTAYGLSPLISTSLEELKANPKPIMTTAYDTGWEAIEGLKPQEIAFLRGQEVPDLSMRLALESKVNLTQAVKVLSQGVHDTEGLLKQYLRDRELPEKTIDGVAESFRTFFPTTTVADPKQVELQETLHQLYSSLAGTAQKIVIKGEPESGSYGGQLVHIYTLADHANAESFATKVLSDMGLSGAEKDKHFPLVVQNYHAGTASSLQLSFPSTYKANQVNLIDFALADQVFIPKGDVTEKTNVFLGSISRFNGLDSLTKNNEQATHLLLSLEAVMHQILVTNGYSGGLPKAIETQALKTFGIDFIQTAAGELKLIDLNPRNTGTLPSLAQSHQKGLLNPSASSTLILGAIPTQKLGLYANEVGIESASKNIRSFIQHQLGQISNQFNVEILPLGTTINSSVITKISRVEGKQHFPTTTFAQDVQLLSNQSAEICQAVFSRSTELINKGSLFDYLTRR